MPPDQRNSTPGHHNQHQPILLSSSAIINATLKRDSSYKKRITWLENTPPAFKSKESRAVIEYIGTFPDTTSIHGNSKQSQGQYIRTASEVINKIKTSAASSQPRKVYTDMVLDSSMDCPHDLKRVQNMKYAVNC